VLRPSSSLPIGQLAATASMAPLPGLDAGPPPDMPRFTDKRRYLPAPSGYLAVKDRSFRVDTTRPEPGLAFMTSSPTSPTRGANHILWTATRGLSNPEVVVLIVMFTTVTRYLPAGTVTDAVPPPCIVTRVFPEILRPASLTGGIFTVQVTGRPELTTASGGTMTLPALAGDNAEAVGPGGGNEIEPSVPKR
jgi:hypothetical protein